MKKLKQVFLMDISPFFRKELKFKKTNKVKLNKGFLYVFILVVFALGIILGSYYSSFLKAQITSVFGSLGNVAEVPLFEPVKEEQTYVSQEEAVISVVKNASPSVVSIIITQEVPVYEQYLERPFGDFFGFEIPRLRQKGTEKQVVGGGTGFIISSDGLVLTNKHVVLEEDAEFTVVLNNGEKYEAQVLARDPFQDLAVLKIAAAALPVLRLGNSDNLQIGQSVITIGNALGEFNNSVSVGVASGLGRTINASGGGMVETLEDVIQTDAAINRGNSGGPLLNLKGEVVGVNVAVAESAQSIGFAIPINKAKRAIEQVKSQGKIVYPFLGVRYIVITPEIQESEGLPVDKGVLIVRGSGVDEPAIVPGSAAEKAGLKENDIILELNGKEITLDYPLSKAIQQYYAGDRISLKILRDGKEIIINAVLGESASD